MGFLTTSIDNRFDSQRASITLDASGSEGLDTDGQVDIGLANAWTISFWFFVPEAWTDGGSGKQGMVMQIKPEASSVNRIDVEWVATLNRFNVQVYDSAGVHQKEYWIIDRDDLPPSFDSSAWYFMTITWDGTDLKTYRDGIESVVRKNIDVAMTMTNVDRAVALSNEVYGGGIGKDPLEGQWQWLAFWDTALTQPEIEATFNEGSGNFDLQTNQSGYSSADSLVHWWRLGLDPDDIGADQVGTITLVGQGSFGVANIVPEIPQKFNSGNPEDFGYQRSLLLGSGENVQLTSVFPGGSFIGSSNNFTVSVWCKPTDFSAGSRCAFAVNGWTAGTNNNMGINLTLEGGSPADAKITLFDVSGVVAKEYDYSDFTGVGNSEVWVNWIFNWNGTDIVAYRNGSVQTPAKPTDDALTRTGHSWRYMFGNDHNGDQWIGNLGHIAVWDVILTSDEAAAIAGVDFQTDLTIDFGDYASRDGIRFYYKLGWYANDGGEQPLNLNIGKSFTNGQSGGGNNPATAFTGVDETNSVVDAP